jgi:peptidoglycan/xylan/chitin deacetylase (PgdA/CDA1 family)/Tfp pilus assembly protein PilF
MKVKDIPILMYHEVGAEGGEWSISPEEFEQQMKLLKEENFQAITLSKLDYLLKETEEIDWKAVVITFDDGRKGVSDIAEPIMTRYGYKGNVYIVAKWTEEGKANSVEGYSGLMSWEELKRLERKGWEIGSHSFSHRDLSQLSEGELAEELRSAEELIAKRMSKRVEYFSYPYGKTNKQIEELMRKRYKISVGVGRGFSKKRERMSRQWVVNGTSLKDFKKELYPPKLSACLIVRNEEKFLPGCLSSLSGLADEIIVADTGSSDQSRGIAFRYGAFCYDFKWNDDFSAARNFSLSKASGDWILVIDADEMLAEEDKEAILEAINDWNCWGYNMMTRNYSNDSAVSGWLPVKRGDFYTSGFFGYFPSWKVRLFQRKEALMFRGRVHEMIDWKYTLVEGKISVLPAEIHHYGALRGGEDEKRGYYLDLAKMKAEEEGKSSKAFYELGIQYKQVGKYGEAEEALKKSIEIEESSVQQHLNLAIVQQKEGKFSSAKESYNLVLKKGENADAYFGLGYIYLKEGKLELAEKNLLLAMERNPLMVDAYINLGAVYEREGKLKEAEKMLVRGLKLMENNPLLWNNLAVVLEKQFRVEEAVIGYEQAVKLGHPRSREISERVERMKRFIEESSDKES